MDHPDVPVRTLRARARRKSLRREEGDVQGMGATSSDSRRTSGEPVDGSTTPRHT